MGITATKSSINREEYIEMQPTSGNHTHTLIWMHSLGETPTRWHEFFDHT